jgi:hypothetical protein
MKINTNEMAASIATITILLTLETLMLLPPLESEHLLGNLFPQKNAVARVRGNSVKNRIKKFSARQ